jgi:hypothetical protein
MDIEAIELEAPKPESIRDMPEPNGLAARTWAVILILFFTPLAGYWPTIFHYYGLRDGYSTLREAHEEPGKVIQFCASHARPIYGRLLENTFRQINTVHDLQWIRLLSSLLLGALALASYHSLRRLGWSSNLSFVFGMWIVLVPSAQIIAGWSIGWPYTIAAFPALGAFFVADHAIVTHGKQWRAVVWWCAAMTLLALSALIYQPSALFYAVPFAAALIARRDRSAMESVRWVFAHLGSVVGALGLAYGTMSAFYAAGYFVRSDRIVFEHHWLTKIEWFLNAPLPNALSLFVINDDNHRDHLAYLLCATFVGLVLIIGSGLEWRRHGWSRGLVWIAGLLGLPLFAFMVNMVAAERYATYRTILSLTGVLLCFLVASFRPLTGWLGVRGRKVAVILVITAAFLTARHRAYALLAVPQGNEWQLMLEGAEQVKLDGSPPRVFAIEPTLADISTDTIYHDEFGSLSTNSTWVPKEMFKRAMHEIHPGVPDLEQQFEFSSGPKLPGGQHYDIVIDLHQLRRFRPTN